MCSLVKCEIWTYFLEETAKCGEPRSEMLNGESGLFLVLSVELTLGVHLAETKSLGDARVNYGILDFETGVESAD